MLLKIKEIRERKNMTQEYVALKCGFSKRSFCNYEAGKYDIPFNKLQNIANALQVSISELSDGSSLPEVGKDNYTVNNIKENIVEEKKIEYERLLGNVEIYIKNIDDLKQQNEKLQKEKDELYRKYIECLSILKQNTG